MQRKLWAARAACSFYLIALTTLLLVPDPMVWLLGVVPEASVPGRGVHFSVFFLLAIFVGASRLPWRASVLAATAVVYAIVVESLQGLVESRVVESVDYAENLLGLAIGALVWRLGGRHLRKRCGVDRSQRVDATDDSA
jgi:hypothetical protein